MQPRGGTFPWGAATWTAVLLLTGTFHLFRGAIVDGLVFLVAGLAVAGDQIFASRRRGNRNGQAGAWAWMSRWASWRPARSLLGGIVLAAVAVLLIVAPLYQGIVVAVVLLIGIAIIPVAWATPSARRDAPAPGDRTAFRRATFLWIGIALAGCIWELGAYYLGRPTAETDIAFPALSDLIDPLVHNPVGRAVFVLLWLATGIGLLRRGKTS